MNILVIGNGFDLAHELPTKYSDFLRFVGSFKDCYEKVQNNQINWGYYVTTDQINLFLIKWFSEYYENENGQSKDEKNATVKIIKEFYDRIEDNYWIEYFLQCNMYQKENWIDFESEISKVIQQLDNDMHRLSGKYSINDDISDLSNEFLRKKYLEYSAIVSSKNAFKDGYMQKRITYKEMRNRLLADLNRLIRALEIYLCEYIGNIEIQKKSLDIDKLKIDKILSFNYTDTFSKLYRTAVDAEIGDTDSFDYIHGKSDINNTIDTNNMVLGIDEYLPDDRKNKDIEFIAFKKFYQRIHKQTGCKYKKWVDKIRQDYLDHLQEIETAKYRELQYIPDTTQKLFNQHAISAIKRAKCQVHNLYIFGHSLDVTDKDIIRDLILNDNVHTTIFYHNKDVMGQQIANLVKVIGQDELIRRTGGSTKTIEFVLQNPMEPINHLSHLV